MTCYFAGYQLMYSGHLLWEKKEKGSGNCSSGTET
jgi:hypothetical protein